MNHTAARAALQFYVDQGVDIAVLDEAIDRTQHLEVIEVPQSIKTRSKNVQAPATEKFLGKSDALAEAVKLAKASNTLDELRAAIADFDGVAIKKTATNLVFADGLAGADVMVIGDAPGADEDRQGKPFAGANGQLLDKILACIGLSRVSDDPAAAAYLTNLLNWRPPGNRSPNPAEIEVSLPFIERHIQLAKPKIIILCGGVSAKALLGSSESISRLRKKFHDYVPQTAELGTGAAPIPAIVTHHPTYLLSTPSQKKAVWADMLSLQEKLKTL